MTIQNLLRSYKKLKSEVEIVLGRIEAWKKAMSNPETICYLVRTSDKEPGISRGTFSMKSPVESEVLSKEIDPEKAIELVKEWIKEDEAKIFYKRLKLERIEKALDSLSTAEKFIVECKYFEKMIWRDIEISYNDKYTRKNNYITESGLRKKHTEILEQLTKILKPHIPRLK